MRSVLWGICLVALVGCDTGVVFQQDVAIPDGAWKRNFSPEFGFDITDTVSKHNVYIDVRHTGNYAYSDMFVFIDLEGPNGKRMRDTVQCLLADPMGRWYGTGTGFLVADRYEAKVLYKLNNRFPAVGHYTMKLEQAMRTEKLDGVVDIGVSVERAK